MHPCGATLSRYKPEHGEPAESGLGETGSMLQGDGDDQEGAGAEGWRTRDAAPSHLCRGAASSRRLIRSLLRPFCDIPQTLQRNPGRCRWRRAQGVSEWRHNPCHHPPVLFPSGREDEIALVQHVMPLQGDFCGGEELHMDIHHGVVAVEVVADLDLALVSGCLGADELKVRLRF